RRRPASQQPDRDRSALGHFLAPRQPSAHERRPVAKPSPSAPIQTMSKSVFAIAKTRAQAERIVGDLQAARFSSDAISVLFPDQGTTRDFAHEKNTKAPE